jgi:hypothetical protein
MLLVKVVCSDPACIEEREIAVHDLDEVDSEFCECGYGFAVVTVSELNEPARSGSLVSLPKRRRTPTRKAA